MRFSSCRWLLLILALAACQSVPPEPGMKLGRPYAVDGEMYYPEYEPSYDKTGEASWYGPGFHGKYTASGEVFNENDLTAAHPTLPMPSLVRVTNLSTGKSLIVRINDRGPFKSHRIIDLSKAAAQRLGIRSIARVRVQFLKKETEQYLASIRDGGPYAIDMVQYNEDAGRPPQPQIVENDDASTHAGQLVDDAAPVVTVRTSELETPANAKPQRGGGLIKAAWADENAPGFNPPLSKVPTPAVQAASVRNEPSSVLTDAVSGGYIVQVGSFAAEQNARKLASELAGMASVDRIDIGRKPLWRVRLGPFDNKQSADNALARARAAGISDAKIIHL